MIKEYAACRLCPRECGVDRRTQTGYCGQSDEIRVARAALHFWEEPCLSGKEGSGAVFFCGCTLGCVYCQNAEISRGRTMCENGKTVSVERLAEIFCELSGKGANNINLVTPTMFVPQIAEAILLAKKQGMTLPIVYNTSGYEKIETLQKLDGLIDIYLPDLKYLSPGLSRNYSHAADYPTAACAALGEMVRQTGEASFNGRGMMTRGVIVRHLLLPGQLAESKRVLSYLFETYGNSIYYSLMSQYTPTAALDRDAYPELGRRVTTYEYEKLIDFALSLGIKNGFRQDGRSAKESFIPSFHGEGV